MVSLMNKQPTCLNEIKHYCDGCSFKCQATECDCMCHTGEWKRGFDFTKAKVQELVMLHIWNRIQFWQKIGHYDSIDKIRTYDELVDCLIILFNISDKMLEEYKKKVKG